MKGARDWGCTGLTELSPGINKQHLKETGVKKIREDKKTPGHLGWAVSDKKKIDKVLISVRATTVKNRLFKKF